MNPVAEIKTCDMEYIVSYTEIDEEGSMAYVGYHSFNDEPAVVWSNGDKEWYFKGSLHRDNGPAIVRPNRDITEYWSHGKRHRIGGPALIEKDQFWFYVNHKLMSYERYKEWMLAVHLTDYISPEVEEWNNYGLGISSHQTASRRSKSGKIQTKG